MLRKFLVLALLTATATLLTASRVHAWGAFHVGYTHVGAGGVEHFGRTAAVGPYGAYSGGHVGAYGYGGASYHAGYGYGGTYGSSYSSYHYAASPYYGSYYGGMSSASLYGGEYRAGVYRGF
jgi:hypothetical protein